MLTFEKFVEGEKSELLEVIKSISEEVGAHDQTLSDRANWDWRYENLPLGKSHIYLAKENNAIIGYYHIPTYEILIQNRKMTIGNIQSVAVSKTHRNKNVFQNLAKFANQDINQFVDLIYTFPNHRSIHTFIKYNNFDIIGGLPLYLKPISVKSFLNKRLKIKYLGSFFGGLLEYYGRFKGKALNSYDTLEEFKGFSNEIESVFVKFSSRHEIKLLRDIQYLEWRFNKSPYADYKIVGLRTNSELKAIAVVKLDFVLDERCLILMDLAYDEVNCAKKLLSNLDKLYTNEEIAFLVKSGISVDKNLETSVGFIKIPNKFNPRQLNLLARWADPNLSASALKSAKWQISFSDWDVF